VYKHPLAQEFSERMENTREMLANLQANQKELAKDIGDTANELVLLDF
jgi:hypothetical protein